MVKQFYKTESIDGQDVIISVANDQTGNESELLSMGYMLWAETPTVTPPVEWVSGDLVYLLKVVGGEVVERTELDKYPLSQAKTDKKNAIHSNTKRLINSNSFAYDNKDFGAGDTDQANWNTLLNLKDRISYPLNDMVKDWEGQYYSIADATEAENIVLAGMSFVNYYRSSDKTLCDSVDACTTVAEVEAIVDDRT